MGVVDGDGAWVVPPAFSLLFLGDSDRIAFLRSFDEDRMGFLDGAGSVVIPAIYSQADAFVEGLAHVSDAEGALFLRPDGTNAFGRRFEDALSFSVGYAPVRDNGRWGSSTARDTSRSSRRWTRSVLMTARSSPFARERSGASPGSTGRSAANAISWSWAFHEKGASPSCARRSGA